MSLGKLEHVDLRKQWPDESKDFTPWLSSEEGLSLLGEAIGMELELEATEVTVGNYRADIVAKDTLSNQYVVIENQLETTNHDHIGKLFTYAASFNASVLIWIAGKHREEHRQAIDWFNEITFENVDFYGIEVELLKIGKSPLAPNIKIVSKPNESTRSVRAEKAKITEGGSLKVEWWTSFNGYIEDHSLDIRKRKPSVNHWYDVAMGKSGIHFTLQVRFTWGEDISCEVYIDDSKDLFHSLHKEKNQIESIIGKKLEWNELPEAKASRIILRHKIDPNERNDWDKCFKWYADTLTKFREAFIPLVKNP